MNAVYVVEKSEYLSGCSQLMHICEEFGMAKACADLDGTDYDGPWVHVVKDHHNGSLLEWYERPYGGGLGEVTIQIWCVE